MNYFALAGAIFAGLFALVAVLRILVVYCFGKYWVGPLGLQINVLQVGIGAPLAAWLLSLAIS